MGIETAIIAAVALAGTAASVHQSRSAARESKDAARDQAAAVKMQTRKLEEERAQADQTEQNRLARARQQMLSAGQGGYQSTIHTSPLGLSSNANQKKLGE